MPITQQKDDLEVAKQGIDGIICLSFIHMSTF